MSKAEKENRIHSFALEFLERQQIVPNLYADQIIRGYKEGYHQAEKDLELTCEDIDWIVGEVIHCVSEDSEAEAEQICKEVLKQFKDYKKGG